MHPTLIPLVIVLMFTACARVPRHYTVNSASIQTPARVDPVDPASTMNINTASAVELESLPGIGPALAARIITHRQEHGPFRQVAHLMMVRGISDRKLREIRSLVKVD